MASTYLSRTYTTPTDVKIGTLSFWIKLCDISDDSGIIGEFTDTDNRSNFTHASSGVISIFEKQGGSVVWNVVTSRLFRDTSAWYHIVLAIDTTQATASNRLKLYVNGVQETSWTTENYPTQNYEMQLFKATEKRIGQTATAGGFSSNLSDLMAHFHFIDGTAYDADTFGQTDSASGIWKPKTSPSVTYGTNGFFLDFANSSDLGNDVSGNNNDFTMSGSGTQTLDTPSNVFVTLNPLDYGNNSTTNASLSLGNTKALSSATSWKHSHGTLGISQGKWYFEGKASAVADGDTGLLMGWCDPTYPTNDDPNSGTSSSYALQGYTFYEPTGKTDNFFPQLSAGDIIMSALDLDNGKIWFGKNGTWYNTGGIAGSTGNQSSTIDTNNPDATGVAVDTSGAGVYVPFTASYNDGFYEFNFGNGYFGTTAVSTPESDSAGLGKFEYSVPSGFYALCTKNIADYG